MEISNEQWAVGAVATITAFFFGKSGIFQKTLDFLLGRFKSKDEREQSELEKRAKQIEDLKVQVDELKTVIAKLDKDLVKTTTYVKTLLAYLETLMPEGTSPFIVEMAKEIRNTNG
jgi:septal ring factor EnvC (AmiA/AmiB activator)